MVPCLYCKIMPKQTQESNLPDLVAQLNIDLLDYASKISNTVPGEYGTRKCILKAVHRMTFGLYQPNTISKNWGAALKTPPETALILAKCHYVLTKIGEAYPELKKEIRTWGQ